MLHDLKEVGIGGTFLLPFIGAFLVTDQPDGRARVRIKWTNENDLKLVLQSENTQSTTFVRTETPARPVPLPLPLLQKFVQVTPPPSTWSNENEHESNCHDVSNGHGAHLIPSHTKKQPAPRLSCPSYARLVCCSVHNPEQHRVKLAKRTIRNMYLLSPSRIKR